MRAKSIRELAKRAGTKNLIRFAEEHGFQKSAYMATGDDVVYYHPTLKFRGASAYIKITLNVKEGIPMNTMKTIIATSCLSREVWSKGL